MSDAITEARYEHKRREANERREKIIALGYELTELRAQRQELDILLREKEERLTELLREK